MTQRQFEGRSAAEAAIKACEVLGTTRSALRYEVVSEEGEKLSRRVVISVDISAMPKPAAPQAAPAAPPPSRGQVPTGAQAPATTREGNFALSDEADMPARRNRIPERVDRGGRRGRSGGDNRGGGRGDRNASRGGERNNARAERAAPAEAQPAERGEGRGGRGRRNEPRAESRAPAGRERGRGRTRERAPNPSGGGRQQDDNGIEALLSMEASNIAVVRKPAIAPQGPRSQHALQVAGDLVRLMGMDLVPALVAEDEAEMHIDLVGGDEARIIGRKGEVLLALQFVLNRIISRGEVEGEQVVVLDAGGYRERRRVALQDLATKLANRAIEARKAVRLSPMSAHDRRIFHMTLKEIEGVTTRSEGDGLYRNLLIIPAEFV